MSKEDVLRILNKPYENDIIEIIYGGHKVRINGSENIQKVIDFVNQMPLICGTDIELKQVINFIDTKL